MDPKSDEEKMIHELLKQMDGLRARLTRPTGAEGRERAWAPGRETDSGLASAHKFERTRRDLETIREPSLSDPDLNRSANRSVTRVRIGDETTAILLRNREQAWNIPETAGSSRTIIRGPTFRLRNQPHLPNIGPMHMLLLARRSTNGRDRPILCVSRT